MHTVYWPMHSEGYHRVKLYKHLNGKIHDALVHSMQTILKKQFSTREFGILHKLTWLSVQSHYTPLQKSMDGLHQHDHRIMVFVSTHVILAKSIGYTSIEDSKPSSPFFLRWSCCLCRIFIYAQASFTLCTSKTISCSTM